METKLTDFTIVQLHKLLVAVLAEMAIDNYSAKDEDLKLWMVKILNAISTVKMRERTEQN